jgi:uncharacterized repeat protein (TIGR01451 family)
MGVVVTDVLPPNVVVADLSPACIAGVSVVCVLGDMTVGQTAVITLTVTPTQTGFVTNTAVVVGSDVELVPANNEAAVGTLVTLISDLSIHKMASSAWLNLAEPLTYTLLITNNGPSMATNVVVTDVLPVGMSLIGQSSDCVGVLVIVCNVGDLAMGGTAAFTVTVTPTATGIFTNTAVVLGNESDMDMSNNAAEVGTAVLPVIDLVIEKTGSSDWLYVGHILTYSLSISNSGPSPATGVIVTDNLPANVVILGMSEDCMPAIDDIVCGIGDMTVGETAVFTITVTPTTTGVLTNTAVVQGHEADANEINNEDGAVTAVLPVTDLVIEKTGSSDWLYVGETLMYSLVISNSGPSPATNVVVTDSLPANVVVQGMSGRML